MDFIVKNPELLRHVRAELRPERMLASGSVAGIICVLIGFSVWSATLNSASSHFFHLYYAWLASIEAIVLVLWTLTATMQSIARERELKTYDFLKTTRLSSSELLAGKLLGAPVMAYFTVGITVPVALVSAVLGGYNLFAVLLTYLLMVVVTLFVGLIGLWFSMLMEKPQPGGMILGLFFLWYLTAAGISMGASPLAGFSAISPLPAVYSLYPEAGLFRLGLQSPTIFGFPVPWLIVSLFLYFSLGAWVVLMLQRNLKRDIDEMRMLSRWQSVGFFVYMNVLFFAFLDLSTRATVYGYRYSTKANDAAIMAVMMNSWLLYWVGLATLSPRERLKVWWRRRTATPNWYLAEDALPWPWLVVCAMIGFFCLAAYASGSRASITFSDWNLNRMLLATVAMLVFACRDTLFLQFCAITRMKRPIIKGVLWLVLYYVTSGVVILVSTAGGAGQVGSAAALLSPYGVLVPKVGVPAIVAGIVLQTALIAMIHAAIAKRLSRPAYAPPAASAVNA